MRDWRMNIEILIIIYIRIFVSYSYDILISIRNPNHDVILIIWGIGPEALFS